MREIIQLSFGKESNYLQTHFWNFEDERLKAGGPDGQAVGQNEQTVVLYYEQPSTGQMVPRALMNDFRDNFGNFSACFAVETESEASAAQTSAYQDRFGNSLEEHKGSGSGQHTWSGAIDVSRQDPIALSAFHQELNSFAAIQADEYGEEVFEEDNQQEMDRRPRDDSSDEEEER